MKYIPILRLRSVENGLLSDEIDNSNSIFPLIEVIDEEILEQNISDISSKFDNLMVELPIYLSGKPNKHQQNVEEIIDEYSSNGQDAQVYLYKYYLNDILEKKHNFIPVLSTEIRNTTYSNFIERYNELKKNFNRIAFRLFVYSVELTQNQKDNIRTIVDSIRDDDIFLLDVIKFKDVGEMVYTNLNEIKQIIDTNQVYLLNAFDYDGMNEAHNYDPLLSLHLKFNGFGDFATIVRYETSGGGGATTKRIRYYDFNNNNLIHFVHDSNYRDAAQGLISSRYWGEMKNNTTADHLSVCNRCNMVENTQYNNGHTWWKKYRIMHYLNSIIHHVIPELITYTNPEDFDPDGYSNIIKKTPDIP